MSCSSLWLVDKDFIGEEGIEFGNSWLFSPVVGNVLFNKYLPEKTMSAHGKTDYIIASMFDNTIIPKLNEKINYCDIQEDRILWELSNQQIFESKDKDFVADCIIKFLDINKEYMTDIGEHILDRFKEISDIIRDIDITQNAYFIFKNTSCDDGVEYWFRQYNEEEDEYEKSSLLNLDKAVAELVVIKDNEIVQFVLNTKLKDYLKYNN